MDQDPTAQKNHIPTDAELPNLEKLAREHDRLLYHLKTEIKSAKATHEELLVKYQQQLRQLEDTKSQLHEAERAVNTITNQRLTIQAERDRIRGMLHPIRRCPSDILQYIFEFAYDSIGLHGRLRFSFELSHICQRWRAIALDTPRIWSYIDISKGDDLGSTLPFWDCIIPRVKSVPATVVINDLNEEGCIRLRECNLQSIPKIAELALTIYEMKHLDLVVTSLLSLSKSELHYINVEVREGMESYDAANYHAIWDMVTLLDAFPQVLKIRLNAPCILRITHSSKFERLESITLMDFDSFDIDVIFSSCKRLLYLRINGHVSVANSTTRLTSKYLQTLIVSMPDTSWLAILVCPNLTVFHTERGISNAGFSFIERHRSLLAVRDIGVGVTSRLAAIAPQLHSLHVGPIELNSLCARGIPQFTSLKRLAILPNSLGAQDLSLEMFETIVIRRCLPLSHPLSEVPQPLLPLGSLFLFRYPEDSADDEKWRTSELYKQAQKWFIDADEDSKWKGYEIIELHWA